MIDLKAPIRAAILADDLADDLALYYGTPAVFTRRPAPQDAAYPFIIIGDVDLGPENDFVDKKSRAYPHNVVVYGQNDTSANYRKVEEIGFKLITLFARLSDLTMPTGWHFIDAVGRGPFNAPTDDIDKVARAVAVTFNVMET